MLGNAIIAFIVFGAFMRAGQEYGKNGAAWGAIGVASFFVPSFIIPILVTLVLTLGGASRDAAVGAFTLTGLLGFAGGVLTAIWSYNKLMDRAIDAQAAKDAQEAAAAAEKPISSPEQAV
jgi:hypothetical protein